MVINNWSKPRPQITREKWISLGSVQCSYHLRLKKKLRPTKLGVIETTFNEKQTDLSFKPTPRLVFEICSLSVNTNPKIFAFVCQNFLFILLDHSISACVRSQLIATPLFISFLFVESEKWNQFESRQEFSRYVVSFGIFVNFYCASCLKKIF